MSIAPSNNETTSPNRFLDHLATGQPLILAEGYVFELERRGYLSAGAFVPSVLLEDVEGVRQLTREYVRSGSTIIPALTYYVNKTKLNILGYDANGELLHKINKIALDLAWEVAREFEDQSILVCGDISNTTSYVPDDAESRKEVLAMFREQAKWAKEANVDFILAETMSYLGEALLALQAIKEVGLPALVNLAFTSDDYTKDGYVLEDAFRKLKEFGADVVGINCNVGPKQILPLLKRVRKAVSGPIAGVPVPYRTSAKCPCFFQLRDSESGSEHKPFPTGMDPFTCTRYEVADFGLRAKELGVQVIGTCCGNGPHHTRALAEALGLTTRASKFSPDMSKHFMLGNDARLLNENVQYATKY